MNVNDWLHQKSPFFERIVCLTEETTEVLYHLGAGDRVVGVSGYTVRPMKARQKPKVSSFLDANYEKILDLKPDIVLGFSDLQAELGAELAKRGVQVLLFNQRSLSELVQSIRIIGALVGKAEEASSWIAEMSDNLQKLANKNAALPFTPKVFFEEWPDPLISGIRWTSELIELLGGQDIFADTRTRHDAKGRIISETDVIEKNPDVIIASWCGKKVKPKTMHQRAGWQSIKAIANDRIYEIKSSMILQPGPACLSDGAKQLADIIHATAHGESYSKAREHFARRADIGERLSS